MPYMNRMYRPLNVPFKQNLQQHSSAVCSAFIVALPDRLVQT